MSRTKVAAMPSVQKCESDSNRCHDRHPQSPQAFGAAVGGKDVPHPINCCLEAPVESNDKDGAVASYRHGATLQRIAEMSALQDADELS